MINRSKLAIATLVTVVGIASPALAESLHVFRQDSAPPWSMRGYERTDVKATSDTIVDPDSPALNGGGSLGYNRSLHYFD
jgi:hypothetical protein